MLKFSSITESHYAEPWRLIKKRGQGSAPQGRGRLFAKKVTRNKVARPGTSGDSMKPKSAFSAKTTTGLAPAGEWMERVSAMAASARPTASASQKAIGPPRLAWPMRQRTPIVVESRCPPKKERGWAIIPRGIPNRMTHEPPSEGSNHGCSVKDSAACVARSATTVAVTCTRRRLGGGGFIAKHPTRFGFPLIAWTMFLFPMKNTQRTGNSDLMPHCAQNIERCKMYFRGVQHGYPSSRPCASSCVPVAGSNWPALPSPVGGMPE
jgi:hypothetical protein